MVEMIVIIFIAIIAILFLLVILVIIKDMFEELCPFYWIEDIWESIKMYFRKKCIMCGCKYYPIKKDGLCSNCYAQIEQTV